MAPSAGYLLGYALAAGVTGALMRLLPRTSRCGGISAFIASALGGLVFLHAMGIAGLVLLAKMPPGRWNRPGVRARRPGQVRALRAVVVHTVAKAMPHWPFGGRSVERRGPAPHALARQLRPGGRCPALFDWVHGPLAHWAHPARCPGVGQ